MTATRGQACPTCHAKVGEFCENIVNGVYYGTYPLYVHPERVAA